MKTKRIIVLVDLSESSKSLLRLADNWALRSDASLVVVHQAFSTAPAMGESELRSEIDLMSRREALKALSAFVSDAGLSGSPARLHITTRNLETALLKLSAANTADLIVVGVRPHGWFQRLFNQVTAIRLVNEINKTVAVLPDQLTEIDLGSLHVAVTERFPLNEVALAALLGWGPSCRFIRILKPDEDQAAATAYLERLCERYAGMADTTFALFKAGDPVAGLKDYMSGQRGMLVLQRGSRRLMDLLRPYFVNEVINQLRVPMVVLP